MDNAIDQRIIELLKNLPPLVACIVWDVVNDNFSSSTIKLAQMANEGVQQQYDIVRCISAANPAHPPTAEALILVELMLEELALPMP